MRDMGAFESRQNSHKEFSHVRNWLSCYSYDSLYVEFDYRGKAIWKWGIFPLLSESFLIVHFFLSKSFLQGGGKLSVSKWEATVSGPQDMGYIWFHLWGYSESAKKNGNIQVFVIYHMAMHSFNSHMVLLFSVLSGRLLHSMLWLLKCLALVV